VASTLDVEAFGLHVRLPAGLLTAPLRQARDDDRRIPTIVTESPDPITAWDPRAVRRLRELRHEGRVVWSVDIDRNLRLQIYAPGLAMMEVSPDGLEISCAPEGDNADPNWPALIIAQALPFAATLRGLEVFHASAITLDGRALLFSGVPGSGKSSLATQLVLRGAGLLSDDAVAVDGDLIAHPSTGSIRLRDAEFARLDQATRDRLSVMPTAQFDGRMIGSVTPVDPAPIAALYVFEHDSQGPAIEPVAVEPAVLLGATFVIASVRTPELLGRHLDMCAQIAARIPVFKLRVTPGIDAGMLAEQVLACR
jgi:hypothetical protein